jgi:hypothetical protein
MKPEECREHAQQCRQHADDADTGLRDNFLSAAEVWDQLADQLERIDQRAAPPADQILVLRLSPTA